jgi:hypothetical protein
LYFRSALCVSALIACSVTPRREAAHLAPATRGVLPTVIFLAAAVARTARGGFCIESGSLVALRDLRQQLARDRLGAIELRGRVVGLPTIALPYASIAWSMACFAS